jgi:hypothetical protein
MLLRRDLGDKNLPVRDLSNPAEIAEILSRTEFPPALKQLGLEGKPNRVQPDAGLPAGVEDRLSHLGFRNKAPKACQIYEILRRSFNSQAKPASVDLKAIDRVLQTTGPAAHSLNAYLVGLYLKITASRKMRGAI